MDETANSRRAAVAAVRDAGATPLVFEFLPAVGVESRPRNDNKPNQRTISQALSEPEQERRRIDNIVAQADRFIGIYAETIGKPQPHLCNLCPVEYEFLRFMIQWRLKLEPNGLSLEDYFPSSLPTGSTPSPLDEERAAIHQQAKALIAVAPSPYRGHLISGAGLSPVYARIMNERVRLFLRGRHDDGAISTNLMRALRHMPVIEFRSKFPEEERPMGRLRPFIPANAVLYDHIFEFASRDLDTDNVKKEAELALLVKMPGEPGITATDILSVLEVLHEEDYDVDRFELCEHHQGKSHAPAILVSFFALGIDSNDTSALTEAKTLVQRLVYERINSYRQSLRRPAAEVTCHENGGHFFSQLLRSARGEHVVPSMLRSKKAIADLAQLLNPPQGRVFVVTVQADNTPGMLYKTLSCIDEAGGSLLSVRLQTPDGSKASRTPTSRAPNAIRYGKMGTIDVVHEVGARATIHAIAAWTSPDEAEKSWPKLRSKLGFLLGVHSVWRGIGTYRAPGNRGDDRATDAEG